MFGFGFRLGLELRAGGSAPPVANAVQSLTVLGPGPLPDGADAADANGWVAKAVLPFEAGASFDPTRIVLTVSDPGFAPDGSAVTRTRTIRGGAVIRRQYPNQAQRLVAETGGELEVHFSLTDELFVGSEIVAAAAEPGYYGAAAAGAIAGAASQSTLAYPKPLFAWLNAQHERAAGTHLAVEAVAYHRFTRGGQQVACIEFAARDEQAVPNSSAMVRASTPALSDFQTQGQRVEAWKASIALAGLTQGDLCQVEAVVKPWIGEKWTLSASGVAWPTGCPQTLLRFLNDKAGNYGGAVACVKAGAAGGAVQAELATARTTPFPTINAAIAALPAWNAANKIGNSTHSGATVYLMDDGAGGAVGHVITANFGTSAGKCLTTIMVDPAATGEVFLDHSTANRAVPNMLRWLGVPITAAFGLDGGSATSNHVEVYENLTVTVAGNAAKISTRSHRTSSRCAILCRRRPAISTIYSSPLKKRFLRLSIPSDIRFFPQVLPAR